MYQPLADALRPASLEDVCGQEHILGPDGLLRRRIGKRPKHDLLRPLGHG